MTCSLPPTNPSRVNSYQVKDRAHELLWSLSLSMGSVKRNEVTGIAFRPKASMIHRQFVLT
eukprot:1904595-Amphidinium_carterae.1